MKLGVLVLALAACGGKDTAPTTPPPSNVVAVPDAGPPDAAKSDIAEVMEAFTGFRDDMCKCTDKACADSVQERMTKWSTEMAAKASDEKSSKPSEAELDQMTKLGQAYGECMMKAMGGGTP